MLSLLLWVFFPWWNRRDWHMAIVWRRGRSQRGWWVMEALSPGVCLNYYTTEQLAAEWTSRHWLPRMDRYKREKLMRAFFNEHINRKYDAAVYVLTLLQYLALRAVEWLQKTFIPWHHFTISLWRVLDNRFTCWELAFAFCRHMGKPVQEAIGKPASRYPLITDFIKAVQHGA